MESSNSNSKERELQLTQRLVKQRHSNCMAWFEQLETHLRDLYLNSSPHAVDAFKPAFHSFFGEEHQTFRLKMYSFPPSRQSWRDLSRDNPLVSVEVLSVGVKSPLNAVSITAALIDVNAAQSKLVLLENCNENYSKCLRLLYKVNAAEGVNAASEEVSIAELVSIAYVIYMDQDSVHMVAASKVPMFKPVIENGATLTKTQVVEGVTTLLPIASAENKAQRRLEDAKLLLEAVEKRFSGNAATKKTQRNLLKQQYENFTALSLEMLDQTFDRLQKLVS
ncbi:hypothetical protein Tco_0267187 [Tanacetum coccineum]